MQGAKKISKKMSTSKNTGLKSSHAEVAKECKEYRKLTVNQKRAIVYLLENPLATNKDIANYAGVSVATAVKYRTSKNFKAVLEFFEGSFEDQIQHARALGIKRLTRTIQEGSNKDANDSIKILEAAAAASEQAELLRSGNMFRHIPTPMEAMKMLQSDPALSNADDDPEVIPLEPLDAEDTKPSEDQE